MRFRIIRSSKVQAVIVLPPDFPLDALNSLTKDGDTVQLVDWTETEVITEVFRQNGKWVERKQPLFLIKR
jgi:hypothetical protein